jgi:hypothetical protein
MMIGLDDAGKTSILNRLHQPQLLGGVLPPTIPTIGVWYSFFIFLETGLEAYFTGHLRIQP